MSKPVEVTVTETEGAKITAIETRFGTFRVGDKIKGSKGVEMEINKFYAGHIHGRDGEIKAHVISTEKRTYSWRNAAGLRHFA